MRPTQADTSPLSREGSAGEPSLKTFYRQGLPVQKARGRTGKTFLTATLLQYHKAGYNSLEQAGYNSLKQDWRGNVSKFAPHEDLQLIAWMKDVFPIKDSFFAFNFLFSPKS